MTGLWAVQKLLLFCCCVSQEAEELLTILITSSHYHTTALPHCTVIVLVLFGHQLTIVETWLLAVGWL
jgi:hypothetical protein